MERSNSGGGPGAPRGFRRLVDITVLATFVLTVLGGVVRVSDSGLGCGAAGSGTEGWPLCEGRLIPFIETNAVVEFSHRLLAGVVVVLIVLLIWRARRDLHSLRWPLQGSLLAGVLVLVQAALGGLTVENNLHEPLVAAHLGMAMLLLGTLLWLAVSARREEAAHRGEVTPTDATRRLPGALTVAATVLLLGAIVAGGYVAGTEKEGAEGPRVVSGAHLACGEQFPGCLNQALPFGESRLVDIHLTHRVLVYAATLAILVLLGVALWRGLRSRLLALAGVLLAAQLLLGVLNVLLGKHASLVVAHLTVATLLWSTILVIGMRFAWIGDPASAARPRRPETSAAPA
jgi:heme A synthase